MAKKKTTLRVDVYPADYTSTGVQYRFKVVDATGDALAYSAVSYKRPSSAWKAAAALLIDPVDEPSAVKRTNVKSVKATRRRLPLGTSKTVRRR